MELNTRYTLTAPDTLSETGLQALRSYLSSFYHLDWMQGRSWLPSLPEDFDFTWQSKGGKFTTRLSKYFYETCGIKLPANVLSEVGNIVRSHQQTGETYHFEFVTEFEWNAGKFADGSSCYWWSNATARDILRDNGAWGICFYDAANVGLGRAWLHNAGDFYVLWNGYFYRAGNPTLTIAKVFAQFRSHPYRRIALYNGGRTDGALWIDSGIGYLIGPSEKIKLNRFDLGWEAPNTCCICGHVVSEYEEYIGPDGDTYCANCFYDRFENCAYCGEAYHHENITWVDHDAVCDWCLDRHYSYCDKCYEHYPNNLDTCPNCEESEE
ncbi:MAG: hypothetical protein K8L91_04130 [Anaerolineae bacterium]|nr:hypothetical protein [Anaerolineae bacterium]